MNVEEYLLEVFPKQLEAMFNKHNDDLRAHPTHFKLVTKTAQRLNKMTWMLAGFVLCLSVERLPELVKILL